MQNFFKKIEFKPKTSEHCSQVQRPKSGQKLSRQARKVVFECTANGRPCVANDIEDPRVAPVPGESKHSLPFDLFVLCVPCTRRVQLEGGGLLCRCHFDSGRQFCPLLRSETVANFFYFFFFRRFDNK